MERNLGVGRMVLRGFLLLTASTSLFFGIMNFVAAFSGGMFPDGLAATWDRPWWIRVTQGLFLVGFGVFLGIVYRNLTKRWCPESPASEGRDEELKD